MRVRVLVHRCPLHRVGVGLKLAQEDGDGRRETEKKARHRGRRDDAPPLLAIHYRLSSFSITQQHRHSTLVLGVKKALIIRFWC